MHRLSAHPYSQLILTPSLCVLHRHNIVLLPCSHRSPTRVRAGLVTVHELLELLRVKLQPEPDFSYSKGWVLRLVEIETGRVGVAGQLGHGK